LKKLDSATAVGLVLAFGSILFGNFLEGGHLSSITQPTAALIVFGGTLGAVFVSFPMADMKAAARAMGQLFGDKPDRTQELIDEIVRYAQLARQEGVLALEAVAAQVENPFFKKGLTMIADGIDSKTVEDTLQLALAELEERGEVPAKVFEAGGGYAPTVGIIGAVLGLIHVMSNLSDIAKVGEGIAVAFVATIYGVAAANLVFLPAATKIKLKHRQEMILHEVMMYGVIAIQRGQNKQTIVELLSVFVHGHGAAHKGSKAKGKAEAETPLEAAA
jgi:chemotaxis protein MotA